MARAGIDASGAALRGDPLVADPFVRQRQHLGRACEELERALDAGDATETGDRLAVLRSAFEAHVTFTEGPDGLFEELLAESVEVSAEVDHLRRDHLRVIGAMDRAADLVGGLRGGALDERQLESLQGVVRLVGQHRRRGADVLYRVYSVDVATGD